MLTTEQRARLKSEAERRGIDPDELIAEAEKLAPDEKPADEKPAKAGAPAKTDKPLYMYHLPFVTVNEVRTVWLGLGPIAGGDANAAKYAAENSGAPATTKPDALTE